MSFQDFYDLGIFNNVLIVNCIFYLLMFVGRFLGKFIDKLIDKAILKYSLNHENDVEDMK